MVYHAVLPAALLTLPIEIRILGLASGMQAAVLCLVLSLVLMEILLCQAKKIPFTSSYLPGRRPVIQTLLIYGAAVSVYVSASAALIESCLQKPRAVALLAALLALWLGTHRFRIQRWDAESLTFEEQDEPMVFSLDLKRE